MPKMYRSWSRVEQLGPIIFWKSFFCCSEYFLYSILMSSKKAFQKIIESVFSTLDHDLQIIVTRCNYFLCSLDPGQSIDNNYSITEVTQNILTQEKHNFSVLSKSNVDEFRNFWHVVNCPKCQNRPVTKNSVKSWRRVIWLCLCVR